MEEMPMTIVALLIFLLFFPGFLCQWIINWLAPRRKKSDFELFIDAAALSVLTYTLYFITSLIFRLPHIPINLTSYEINTASIAAILGWTVISGVLLGRWLASGTLYTWLRGKWVSLDNPRWLQRLEWLQVPKLLTVVKRKMHPPSLTNQTGRRTVWEHTFNTFPSDLIRVHLRDGRVVQGAALWYSDDPERLELLIIPPSPDIVPEEKLQKIIIWEEGQPRPMDEQALLLAPDAEIQFIEFWR